MQRLVNLQQIADPEALGFAEKIQLVSEEREHAPGRRDHGHAKLLAHGRQLRAFGPGADAGVNVEHRRTRGRDRLFALDEGPHRGPQLFQGMKADRRGKALGQLVLGLDLEALRFQRGTDQVGDAGFTQNQDFSPGSEPARARSWPTGWIHASRHASKVAHPLDKGYRVWERRPVRVPNSLSLAFGPEFQKLIGDFAHERGLIPSPEELVSRRFLARSIAPHVTKLSAMFNRTAELKALKEDKTLSPEFSLDPYWKNSSNPENLRLAYFLTFMPSNLFRVASVWTELSRLGFRWSAGGGRLRGIEFGAGPAAGACGIAAGERFAPAGLPQSGDWALLEQDKATLELGARWAERYFASTGAGDWGTRPFHRKLKLDQLLPRSAPRFNLWVMSYFLNEFADPPAEIAGHLLEAWDRHLDEEGIVILVEPALRLLSRRLLEIRREILVQLAEEAPAHSASVPGPPGVRRARGRRGLVPRGSELVAPALSQENRRSHGT